MSADPDRWMVMACGVVASLAGFVLSDQGALGLWMCWLGGAALGVGAMPKAYDERDDA